MIKIRQQLIKKLQRIKARYRISGAYRKLRLQMDFEPTLRQEMEFRYAAARLLEAIGFIPLGFISGSAALLKQEPRGNETRNISVEIERMN